MSLIFWFLINVKVTVFWHQILKLPFHPHFFLVLQFSSDHLQLSGVILIVGSVRVKIWANIYRPGQKHQIWCETSLDNCENILMRKHFLFDLWRSRSKSKISKYLNFIFWLFWLPHFKLFPVSMQILLETSVLMWKYLIEYSNLFENVLLISL